MNKPTWLAEERIKSCDWDVSGGSLVYDISYLHPDFADVTQSYTIESVDWEGRLVYGSEFLFFKKGEAFPSDFGQYPKALKAQLWQVVFAIKRLFFEEVKPDIVLHFIKQPHSVAGRLELYQKQLALPGYLITRNSQEIVYTRQSAAT